MAYLKQSAYRHILKFLPDAMYNDQIAWTTLCTSNTNISITHIVWHMHFGLPCVAGDSFYFQFLHLNEVFDDKLPQICIDMML